MNVRLLFGSLQALVALLILQGCTVDTQFETIVKPDGSVSRTLAIALKDLDRTKETTAYPAKKYILPTAPDWRITNDTPTSFGATLEVPAGQPIPGGYTRELTHLGRTARNTVTLTQRDHFIAQSYRYEERYTDTAELNEARNTLLTQFDLQTERVLAEIEKVYAETHEIGPARQYTTKALRKLFSDSIDSVSRNGLLPAILNAGLRLTMGGFPLPKDKKIMEIDARTAVSLLVEHTLNKTQRKKPEQMGIDESAYAKELAALLGDSAEAQANASAVLRKWGERIGARLLQQQYEMDKESAGYKRIDEVLNAIRAESSEKRSALIARLTKEIEHHYLHPPEAEQSARDKTLATMLGAHIEANFATVEYLFQVNVQLPGELIEVDSLGQRRDGGARWNFAALDFFLREKLCIARSRVWHEERLVQLGSALLGPKRSFNLPQREKIEAELNKLSIADLAAMRTVLSTCVTQQTAAALKALADQPSAELEKQASCAKAILEALSSE